MQQSSDTILLESKLKRLKISFSKENGKLVISKPTSDYITLLGLIFLPMFCGIGILGFLLPADSIIRESHSRKVIAGSIILISIGIINIVRMRGKLKANKLTKVLGHKEITLSSKEISKRFDANNVKHFDYTIKQLDDDMCNGNLFLVDSQNNRHPILGFSGDTEQYVMDDLQWFSNYFSEYIQLKTQK